MNEYDSDKMADVLKASHAMEITESPEETDVLLLNTCALWETDAKSVGRDLNSLPPDSCMTSASLKR